MNQAIMLLALSVCMHVTWNLLARLSDQRANFLWWGLLTHSLLLAPWGLSALVSQVVWQKELVLALIISTSSNLLYFYALRQAYQRASVSFVYPIARSSPIFIALWAWLLFNQSLTLLGLLGIFISIAGLIILAVLDNTKHNQSALKWAGIAALATSMYSLSDQVAVQHLSTFSAQLGYISIGYFCAWLLLCLFEYQQHGRIIPRQRPPWWSILIGGLCIGLAYALVVRVMDSLAAASVVAISNSGIVIACISSILIFKERQAALARMIAAVIISIGIALVIVDL